MKYFNLIILCALMAIAASAQEKSKALDAGLFQLNEMDMHVHAGKERSVPMHQWIDIAVRDGRKVMLLLDHLELYRMDKAEHEQWLEKKKFTDWYPNLETGKTDFMNEVREAQKRTDILLFRGWEIWEGEFEEGLEKEPMKDAEVIGWHLSKAAWDGKSPSGKEIIHRARQIRELQKEFPVPMIIFHPFKSHFSDIKENALEAGRDVSSITKEEYRYFTEAQQKELIDLLGGSSVYIEVSRGWTQLWSDPTIRAAFIEDIRPLVEGGVKFTVSTDAHQVHAYNQPYTPELYCKDLGITPANANAIIRELLAIRAKSN